MHNNIDIATLIGLLGQQMQQPVVTLRFFVDEYLHWGSENRSAKYADSVKLSLKHLTNYFGEHKLIGQIGVHEVEKFIMHLKKEAPRGVHVYYRTIKAAFNKAVDWGYIYSNPLLKIKLPKVQRNKPKFITKDELQLIISKITIEVVRDFVILAFFTGMRRGELINLKWRNVDLEKRIITVGDDDFVTKGKKQREIPFGDEVYEILERKLSLVIASLDAKASSLGCHLININREEKRKRQKGVFVFEKSSGHAYTGDYFSRRFKRACRAAGTDEAIHLHNLRHSYASNLAQKGVSIYVIKDLLGHSSVSTTEIYSHLNLDSLREAVSLL